MNGCATDPVKGSLPALFRQAIAFGISVLGHKRALPDDFDMKPGFKYYRSRDPVIYNSAREAL